MKRIYHLIAAGLLLVSCGQSTVPTMTQETQSESANLTAQAGVYQILARCNVQVIDASIAPNPPPLRVVGRASDRNRDVACREAKRKATQSAPRGTYARHCQCLDVLG